jgi:hypothetical protein
MDQATGSTAGHLRFLNVLSKIFFDALLNLAVDVVVSVGVVRTTTYVHRGGLRGLIHVAV